MAKKKPATKPPAGSFDHAVLTMQKNEIATLHARLESLGLTRKQELAQARQAIHDAREALMATTRALGALEESIRG